MERGTKGVRLIKIKDDKNLYPLYFMREKVL